MKRIIPFILAVLLLTSCSPKPSYTYSGEGWKLAVSGSAERFDFTDLDNLCKQFTNVRANLWYEDSDEYQVFIVECTDFTQAYYRTDSNLYEISADSLTFASQGLKQFYDTSALLNQAPHTYIASTEVIDPGDDGWGTRMSDGVELPWPKDCTSTLTGWYTDDTKFQITPYTEMEDATEDLEAMMASIKAQDVKGFKMWYFRDTQFQGLAWLLDEEYYISLAKYSGTGSYYLTLSAQRDTKKAYDIAAHYGWEEAMDALFKSQPYFEN